MEQKTRKVLEISDGDMQFICIKVAGEKKPYRLYKVWWDGGNHRKLMGKYACIDSVLAPLAQYHNNMNFYLYQGVQKDEAEKKIFGWSF